MAQTLPNYQYKTVLLRNPPDQMESDLNAAATGGWRLVDLIIVRPGPNVWTAVFERPVSS